MAERRAQRSNAGPRKALIVVDKYGWSYDAIAQGLTTRNDRDDLMIEVRSEKEDWDEIGRRQAEYDLVFVMGWTQLFNKKKNANFFERMPFLDRRRLITGVHSHRSWDDYRSRPDFSPPPPAALIDRLAGLRSINIVSRRLFRIFEDAGLRNITLTENGVDTDLFQPSRPVTVDQCAPLVIGFSGSTEIAKHDYLKGLTEFILPLGELPNVDVRVLGGRGENQVPRSGMPALYNQIDLYLCASTSEGFSQSVLEASACGRGVVSTRVGGCEDLIEEGWNGFFIDRDLSRIRDLVRRLEADRTLVRTLGENNRRRVLERYSWHIQANRWLGFIEANLPLAQEKVDAGVR